MVQIWCCYRVLLGQSFIRVVLTETCRDNTMYSSTAYGVSSKCLQLLPSFNLICCIPVDYMHCVLLGVVKKTASLWFDSSHSKNKWQVNWHIKANDFDK